ncbi:MAG: NAD(P)-dependent oxidoreductase [Candidatus Acidiferrales bacterium]
MARLESTRTNDIESEINPTFTKVMGKDIEPGSAVTSHSRLGDFVIRQDDLILVTGASGFIGSRLVESLLNLGFRNLRCFARPASNAARVGALSNFDGHGARVEVIKGNLLTPQDCLAATDGARVIFHLAAGRGEKSYPDAFANSVVTTRNLLDASLRGSCLKRFVNVSSFSVYSNQKKPRGRLLDESCPVEKFPALRGEAYCFAKVEQDEVVAEYGRKFGLPYVIVRPGQVYGPGNEGISGRVGIGTFGLFLHLGGSNTLPLTYVDNCAEAIALAGLRKGIEGQVFNIVDDDLPSSRKFLRLYKKNVKRFPTLYVPHVLSYALCCLWEKYSIWSREQLPPAFNRKRWHAYWKRTRYSNQKAKSQLGWKQKIKTEDGLRRFFESCRGRSVRA